MKVILLEDVKKQGYKGDVIEVSPGFGQNFLIKNKKAVLATEENLLKIKQENEEAKLNRQKEIEEAKLIGKKLISEKFEFFAKAKEGKLFGTYSKKEVAANIEKQTNIKINTHKLTFNVDKIEHVGKFEVTYEIVKNVKVKFPIRVSQIKN